MAEVERDPLRSSSPTLVLRAGSATAGASGLCSAGFWISVKMAPPQLVPVFDHPHRKKKSCILVFRSDFPSFSVCSLPLVLSVGTTGESLAISTPYFHQIFTHGEDPPKTFLLQDEQPQHSQSLFLWQMLQSFNRSSGPALDWLQYIRIFLTLDSPEGDSALQMRLRSQWWVEGNNHLPWPAGKSLPNTAQDTVGCLCSKVALLAHGWLFFCKAASKWSDPYLHRMLFPLVQKCHFCLFFL